MSVIGFVLLMLGIIFGQHGEPRARRWRRMFTFKGETLALILIAYGFVASVLPVWLLLAPRDYLSTFLKIGTIIGLAIGIVIVMPELQMPAVSQVRRRHRPGVLGHPVPVPLHHHRLRRGLGLPRADLLRHDAEDGRERGRRRASSATAPC